MKSACRRKAAALADQLQKVYLRDKKASETVKAAILESLGLLLEASPEVIALIPWDFIGIPISKIDCMYVLDQTGREEVLNSQKRLLMEFIWLSHPTVYFYTVSGFLTGKKSCCVAGFF